MEYCFVSINYPSKNHHIHVFLENVVTRLVDRGETCNVIAPQSYVAYLRKNTRRELVSARETPNGNKYMVYSPLYFIFPKKRIGKLYMGDWTRRMVYKAALRVYKKNGFSADVIYSHFLSAGIVGTMLANKMNIPSFIANGEADTFAETAAYSRKLLRKTLDDVTGIICVSTKNKNEISALCNSDPEVMQKVRIIVNAADSERFHPKDRTEMRKKLGWSQDKFIVAFTGSFIERKGILRLSHALDRFDDVYSVFMGVGSEQPTCKNILHCGSVKNTEISDYLNAADVFVLPTKAEGCCNAIVEAVSCGLPVVSSDREFNYDVLDDTCAILIEPTDENAIFEAIQKIKENCECREQLAQGAKARGENLSLEKRVDFIQEFIGRMIAERDAANF